MLSGPHTVDSSKDRRTIERGAFLCTIWYLTAVSAYVSDGHGLGRATTGADRGSIIRSYVADSRTTVCCLCLYHLEICDWLFDLFLSGARFLKHLHKIYEMPGWLIFCRGGCPLHFGVFSSTPDLCALDTNSSFPTPSWNKWKCPRHYQVSPGGQNHSWLNISLLEGKKNDRFK